MTDYILFDAEMCKVIGFIIFLSGLFAMSMCNRGMEPKRSTAFIGILATILGGVITITAYVSPTVSEKIIILTIGIMIAIFLVFLAIVVIFLFLQAVSVLFSKY